MQNYFSIKMFFLHCLRTVYSRKYTIKKNVSKGTDVPKSSGIQYAFLGRLA